MKDLRFHVMMCKTREGLLSSDSEDDDTLSIYVFASEPHEIQESITSIVTPNIPDASTFGQPENANVSTRTSTDLLAEPVLTVDEIVHKVVAYCL